MDGRYAELIQRHVLSRNTILPPRCGRESKRQRDLLSFFSFLLRSLFLFFLFRAVDCVAPDVSINCYIVADSVFSQIYRAPSPRRVSTGNCTMKSSETYKAARIKRISPRKAHQELVVSQADLGEPWFHQRILVRSKIKNIEIPKSAILDFAVEKKKSSLEASRNFRR